MSEATARHTTMLALAVLLLPATATAAVAVGASTIPMRTVVAVLLDRLDA